MGDYGSIPAGWVHIFGRGSHARVLKSILNESGVSNVLLHDYDTGMDTIPMTAPFIIGVGNAPVVGDSGLRRRDLMVQHREAQTMGLCAKDATITAVTWEGQPQILTRAIVNTGVRFERHVIVNTGAIVEHDCYLGRGCHIAPGAILCGDVTIGRYTHIGAGAVVRQGIRIGSDCVVGAGSVVVDDVPDNTTVMGNPARVVANG